MVRQWQNLLYHQRFSQTTLDRGPDFVKLAEAYGLKASGLHPGGDGAGLWPGPPGGVRLCHRLRLDMDEMVRPMVAGGAISRLSAEIKGASP